MMSLRSRRTAPVPTAALAAILLAAAPIGLRAAEAEVPIENTVKLQLQITGGAPQGCLIDIRPGHPGCKFQPVKRQLDPSTRATALVEPISIAARTVAADRDCSFFITITEPGQPPRTFRRGVRLTPPSEAQPVPVQSLRVYLSSPSVAIRDDGAPIRR